MADPIYQVVLNQYSGTRHIAAVLGDGSLSGRTLCGTGLGEARFREGKPEPLANIPDVDCARCGRSVTLRRGIMAELAALSGDAGPRRMDEISPTLIQRGAPSGGHK